MLRTGVIASASIICLGLIVLASRGFGLDGTRIDATIPYPRSLAALITGLLSLDPASIISLGLLTLIATPFMRVAVSIVAFAEEGDWQYVAITAIVLGILVAGLVMGKAVG